MAVNLRFASLRDAEAIAAIYRPVVEQTAISFETVPPDAAEMRNRIAATLPAKPWIVAVDGDTVAGYAYASAVRSRAAYRFGAEVTVYVADHAQRRGTGRLLYATLIALLTSQGYRRAFAGIALPNDASIGLHRALGFTAAGVWHAAGYKFERWHDVSFWELALGTLDAPNGEPLPVAELTLANVQAAFQAR